MKKTYIKISLEGFNSYTDTIEGAKRLIDQAEDWEDDAVYSFSPIQMTEQEFTDLPEFQGW